MTHDPLCAAHGDCVCNPEDLIVPDCPDEEFHDLRCPKDSPCRCDLIAKVRADEKAKWTHTCPDNNCCNGGPN